MNPYIETIEPAWRNPKHVFLNEEKLREVAERFSKEEFVVPEWRAPVFPGEDSAEFIDFLGIGNSINFCFRDLRTKKRFGMEYKEEQHEGAFGMWASLKRALEEGLNVLDPRFLAKLDLKTTKHIFRGDPPLPMMKERMVCLRQTGEALLRKYGSFSDLFGESGFRAFDNGCGIVERLAKDFPSYDDVSRHPVTGDLLCFYKRANLLVLMYQGRALASKGVLPLIPDVADLTPPADYEVPKSLKYLGILEYDSALERRIIKYQSIPKNSIGEIEIRGQTVNGMTRWIDKINEFRINEFRKEPITIVEGDYRGWFEGRNSPEPHHLTETTAY